MRNLWIFFLRYYAIFLFLFLEVIAFTLIINNNSYQGASYFNSANIVAANIYSSLSDVESYVHLKSVNDSLAIENARLKNQLKSERYSNKVIKGIVTDSASIQRYKYLQAKVVNNTTMKRNNYITLDKGYIHGVRKNMGVICGDGIVGIVKDVSEHFSTVISFLHKDSKLSAQLNSTKDFGSLVWEGVNPREGLLKDIPTHVKITTGDSVTTTGFSSIFPEGVMIGKVKNAEQKSGDNFHNVEVSLSTNFSALRYVYVVTDILSTEKIRLEAKEEEKND
ncbi:MAG: rod shape-determining protein MreC [bacterium]|jgi:rod shape-determining protein MreC